MIWLFIILVAAAALVIAFYAGALFGIADCKRRFSIPKGALGVDVDGNYFFS